MTTIVNEFHDGRKITLSPKGKGGYLVEITKDGTLVWSDSPLDLRKEAHRKKVQAAGVPGDMVLSLAAEVAKAEAAPPAATKGTTEAAAVRLLLRGMNAPQSSAELVTDETPLAALRTILGRSDLPPEALVYWSPKVDLRALDVDWHGPVAPPSPSDVERLALSVKPAPVLYWVTHGGGLRLVYSGQGVFTAAELAACAAAHTATLRPEATLEIKCDTRHPRGLRDGRQAGNVLECLPDTHLAVLGRFSRMGCTEQERDAWLEGQGMTLGGVYAHHFCPIDAHHVSKNAAPVWAGDNGVYCNSCQGRSGDGFRSYGRLAGAVTDEGGPIYEAARQCVHWEQVRYYFQATSGDIPEGLWRDLYSALLKSTHGNEPGMSRVWSAFDHFPFVRGVGVWLDVTGLAPVRPQPGKADVALLPITQEWDNGEIHHDPRMLLDLASSGLVKGMPPLVPRPACAVYAVHNTLKPLPDGGIPVVSLQSERKPRCKYVPQRERMKLDEAWRVIEGFFPGISREYLTLLHVARGYAEMGEGMVPMVFTQGPSGAAKTMTGAIEASMSGDVFKEIGAGKSESIGEAVGDAAYDSGAVAFNEFSKVNSSSGGRIAKFMLQLGRSYTYRKLYVGNITVPLRCYLLLTDTDLPFELSSSEQFGRRVIYVRLKQRVKGWGAGGVVAETWMTQPGAQAAADTIHSWVVDEYFPTGVNRTFADAAAKLGFGTLEAEFRASEDGVSRDEAAVRLFNAVCEREPMKGDRWKGRGWVVGGVDDEACQVGAVLRDLVAMTGEESSSLKAVEAALAPLYGRWQELLTLKHPTRCELKRQAGKLYIRFRSDNRAESYLSNAELKDGES